jgi:hypothetical protein
MHPENNFSPAPPQLKREDLQELLKETEIADLIDAAVERRVGEVIGRVLFNPKKQWW